MTTEMVCDTDHDDDEKETQWARNILADLKAKIEKPINGRGGKTMKGRIFAGLFLCSLFFVVGGDAQSPDKAGKTVWTMEFTKVQPENFALTMQYLHDHWMRVRAEAKQQGAVLDYHLISNEGIETPGHKVWDQGVFPAGDSIVLLTKYKNMDAYLESVAAREQGNSQRFVFGFGGLYRYKPEDLFERLNTQVFVEEPDTSAGFKLIAKQ